jgi:multidrug efflux pump subunit AcrA (membrane-fusion protein)
MNATPVAPTAPPSRLRAARVLRPACVLVVALAVAVGAPAQPRAPGAGKPGAGKPGAGAPDPPPLRTTTAVVEGRPVQRSVDTVGSLLAWEETVARSQIQGTVVRLHADLGDAVREGQPLADLDRREADLTVDQLNADLVAARENLARSRAAADASRANLERIRESRRALGADLERARADAEWKRRELERNQELRAKELIAARDVDQARAQSQAAEAVVQMAETTLGQHAEQVRAAEAQWEADLGAIKSAEAQVHQREAALEFGRKRATDTVVAAPLTGVVARRHVTAGEFVKDNTPLFTLVATDPLKYAGTVPERATPEIRAGQEVRLTVDAFGARAFPGQVTRVAPVVDVPTRTLALEAKVPNGQGLLRPGFFARGVVRVRRDARVPFVPAEALAYVVGISKVFVVANGRAQERLVKAGLREAGRVEILEGVKPGETVATSGLAQLYDGAPIQPGAPAPAAKP